MEWGVEGLVDTGATYDEQDIWQEDMVGTSEQEQKARKDITPTAVLARGISVRQAEVIQMPRAAVLAQLQEWAAMPATPTPTVALQSATVNFEEVWEQCLHDTHFVAGVPNTRHAAWKQFFQWVNAGGPCTKEQAQVLLWIEHGVTIDWVAVRSKDQQKYSRYRKKVELVTQL